MFFTSTSLFDVMEKEDVMDDAIDKKKDIMTASLPHNSAHSTKTADTQPTTVETDINEIKLKSSPLVRSTTLRRISSQTSNISSSSSIKSTNENMRKSSSGHHLYNHDELVFECPISGEPQLKHAALAVGGIAGSGEGEQKYDQLVRPVFDMRDYENIPDTYGDSWSVGSNYFDIDILKYTSFIKLS